jgi:lipopolysaccharide/colanic/teichoic acid biosynthesis glycosyltransferase
MGVMTALVLAITAGLLKDEVIAWLPQIRKAILRIAIRLVPSKHRDRLAEEWAAHINDVPGELSKALVAADFVRSACHINLRERGAFNLLGGAPLSISYAMALLLAFGPLMLSLLVLLKIERRDLPPLVRKKYIGKSGREFYALTFRTRDPDSGKYTRLGRWLASTSVHTLPVFFSMLRGDLALVGPKPRTATELAGLKDALDIYVTMRPGIVFQSMFCSASCSDAAEIEYLKKRTPAGDLKLLAEAIISPWRTRCRH